MSQDGKRKIRFDLSWAEAKAHNTRATFELHDSWNHDRKLQPYVSMELEPYELEYLISMLGEALIKIEDHVIQQRELAIATLQRNL